jgi:hypothetical protein
MGPDLQGEIRGPDVLREAGDDPGLEPRRVNEREYIDASLIAWMRRYGDEDY